MLTVNIKFWDSHEHLLEHLLEHDYEFILLCMGTSALAFAIAVLAEK